MNNINNNEIINLFKNLNESKIEYILLRNIGNELPNSLRIGKDIDLLINKNHQNIKNLESILYKSGYKTISHPHKNDIFLYSCDKFIFKYNNSNKIKLDLQFQILCRSLNAGEWLPIDQKIQDSAWNNKVMRNNEGLSYWSLSNEDEFITLIVRSIFDKNIFLDDYKNKIIELYELIDINNVEEKLQLIFFKYSSILLNHIKTKNFNSLIDNYIMFKDY